MNCCDGKECDCEVFCQVDSCDIVGQLVSCDILCQIDN